MVTKKIISIVFFTFLLTQIYGAISLVYPNGGQIISPTESSLDINVQLTGTDQNVDIFLCESSSCNLKYPIFLDLNSQSVWDCNASNFCHLDANLQHSRITTDMTDQNILFYWSGDFDDGTVTYRSNIHNGAEDLRDYGSVVIADGVMDGKSFSLAEGTSDYLELTAPADDAIFNRMADEFTIMGYYRFDDFTQHTWMPMRWISSWGAYVRNDAQADANQVKVLGYCNGSSQNFTSTIKLDLAKWYHIAVVYDSGYNMILYIDGNNAGSGNFGGACRTGVDAVRIGTYNKTYYADMDADEFKFYDRGLTISEVQNDFNGSYFDVNTSPNQEWVICAEASSGTDCSDANITLGISAIANYDINFNVYEAGTSNHLTSVIMDFNIDSRDVNGNSPFDLNFDLADYDVNVSKSGYDANNNYVFSADSDKTITIYLTKTYIPPTHYPPKKYFSPTEDK